jgi:hypothetical protein
VEQEVIEIDGVRRRQVALVGSKALADGVVEVALGLEVGRAPALLLLGVDAGEHLPGRVAPIVEVELLEDAVHHRALISVVVDDEAPLEPSGLVVAAEQADADRVEGADPEILADVRPEQLIEPGLHLAGGLVGEGDGEDAVGRDAVERDEVGDPVDDDARLAAAGAREDQERAIEVGHRL